MPSGRLITGLNGSRPTRGTLNFAARLLTGKSTRGFQQFSAHDLESMFALGLEEKQA